MKSTDLDLFKAFKESAGIIPQRHELDNGNTEYVIEEGDKRTNGTAIEGYNGFMTVFTFSKTGELIKMGAYE